MGRRFAVALLACAVVLSLLPASAWGVDGEGTDSSDRSGSAGVSVSADGEAALASDASFALRDFSRAQKGSNREIDGAYIGYSYYQGASDDYLVAVNAGDFVAVHVPRAALDFVDPDDADDRRAIQECLIALDAAAVNGGIVLDGGVPWYFTVDQSFERDGVVYSFGVEADEGRYYVTVAGVDGSDAVEEGGAKARPVHVDFARFASPDAVDIVEPTTGLAAFGEFLAELDWSPLWVTLKTTGVAIVFIFVLGLAAAYFSLRIPKRAQDVADTVFTIPMVLPPTVCGFVLLLALGNNSVVGRWFIEHGFSLVFSWPATVIAAVVVAFPLMYRSARGAFEGIDPAMLDAARTLGWSNGRIFFRLMLPLAWSSIAAGAVLAFARALGEFGATLFLAGNYAGITRTIPIAIYFEWMGGDTDTALFWTCVVIAFSFLVILFINLWGKRTTKYRKRTID